MTLAKVKVTYFKVKCWKWAKNKDGSYISYDAFQLLFPWLRNSDSQYSISQKLMDRGKNWPKMQIFLEDMHAVQLKPIIMWISSKTLYIYNSYDFAQGQGHQF